MNLKKIANSIKNNPYILEKKEINPIVQYIDKNSFKSIKIFSDIGEDSAAISNEDNYILMTTDRIKTSFIENFPIGAGFSSILVGVDDIYCCGGVPLAASLIISYKEEKIGEKIIEGICEGSKKFKVPIVRGHTNPNGDHYELSSTMVGEIQKRNYISAKNAQINDYIILAVDFNGKVGKASDLYWDTVTFKSSEEILFERKSMNKIAKLQLVNSSKDISNGGIFGTLLQIIKYSKVGANVNINKITIPPRLIDKGYDLEKYIKMYLTTSYLITVSPQKYKSVIKVFKEFGLIANVIGKIIKEKKILRINDGIESVDVIKL
ncbi:MAG: AIR synthase related protein [Promethearchaeota archaeon]